MREKRWLLLVLYGILLANAVSGALKATRPKFKIATTSTTTTTEETHVEENNNEKDSEGGESTTVATETNATTGHTLTGIPQIDYIWDPNLPRELNGYNLSDYPFYSSIPEDIDFKCDGLHDGFYASVPHKCQVYHHCLYGTRYDFLCANFTAFDQKTFICHFVSEVDCAKSKNYWHRNNDLYKATTTSTSTTSTTTTTTVAPIAGRPRDKGSSRRTDPLLRRRRPNDYYDEDYYDDDYNWRRDPGRRDEYEYDDRYWDRDRDFRDRYRDGPRYRNDRYHGRGTRRDPPRERIPLEDDVRTVREPSRERGPLEDDIRPRGRDQDQGSRSRETDDSDLSDRRPEYRSRDSDDRRYSNKRLRDEYDDKEPTSAAATGNSKGLVKPSAPSTSVYARPRAPPKIRRPVPLSEQDKYAYKATSVQSTEEPRRRPVDVAEDDYYEDELEEVRPIRRPSRRRPAGGYRDRDRDVYDSRDRDRDRPFRTSYRNDDDYVRPRKHPDRSRDRYYDRERDRGVERGRDRLSDRNKDRTPERSLDRDRGRIQDPERQERPYSSRPLDRDVDRPRSSSRSKDISDVTETPARSNTHERPAERTATTSTTTTSTTSTTCLPEDLTRKIEPEVKDNRNERIEEPHSERPLRINYSNQNTGYTQLENYETHRDLPEKSHRHQQSDYQERDQDDGNEQSHHQGTSDEYSSEYYDEPEDPPSPPPRTTVRIVKRPFLPSRGGNPNPRGLQPVGSKAPTSGRRDEERIPERTTPQDEHKGYYVQENVQDNQRDSERKMNEEEVKQRYDAYKVIQADLQQKQRTEEYDTAAVRPVIRRPIDRSRDEESKILEEPSTVRGAPNQGHTETGTTFEVPTSKWTTEEYSTDKNNNANLQISSIPPSRNKARLPTTDTTSIYGSTYKNEDVQEPTGPSNYRIKQRINEVTHRLQDIPESEYDVTLNDALTPTLNQEANLPSGFVLPLHRQLGRDTVLQSSENNYKLSRPLHQQHQQQQLHQQQQQQQQQLHQQQQQQQQQQKPFVPSPQFLPTSVNPNERGRTVYYRTPETIQISGAQYRQQRGPWHEYTGY